jgi:integrase
MDYPVTLRSGVVVNNAAEHIANYKPNSIPRAEWDNVIGPFVRDCVTKTGSQKRYTVLHSLRGTAGLAVWARQQGIPLDPERVFALETVERYVTVGLPNLSKESRRTLRASIRMVGEASTKNVPWEPRPAALPRNHLQAPYAATEVARWWEIATTQSTPGRARTAQAVIALGLGIGILPAENLDVTGRCVRRDGDVLLVDIPGGRARTVACGAEWADRLEAVAAQYPSEPLIGAVSRNRNRVNSLVTRVEIPAGMPRLVPARLRSTWIVGLLNRGVPIPALMSAVGWTAIPRLDDYMRYLTVTDEKTRYRLVAGLSDD